MNDVTIEDEQLEKFPEDFFSYDKSDMRSVIKGFPFHIKEAYRHGKDTKVTRANKVVVLGMGGSAIGGDILKKYLPELDITVNRQYNLTTDVDKETLVFASSYSGNTEETISAYKEATRKGCQIICITTGGKLAEMAKTNRHEIIRLPKGLQPRAALAYSFFPMIRLLENAGMIDSKKAEVDRLAKTLDKKLYEELGLKISDKLNGRVPLIYSAEYFEPAAYRWKTQLNENAKTMAFYHVFSELNHNELSATRNNVADFYCVILRSGEEKSRMVKRMELTKEHYRKHGINVTEMLIKGETPLIRLFTAIYIGDWTSYYLALRYRTDPTPVEEVELFKKELGSFIS